MTNSLRKAFVGLGSNKAWLGKSPELILYLASDSLRALGSSVQLSPLYDSPAWPDPSAPAYVNGVAVLATSMEPETFLEGLLAIEAGFGRVRSEDPDLRYAPRTLDLDLLAMTDAVRDTERLTLPHPRLHERDFVLLPLRDLAPGFVHPVSGQPVEAMIDALPEVTARKRAK